MKFSSLTVQANNQPHHSMPVPLSSHLTVSTVRATAATALLLAFAPLLRAARDSTVPGWT